MLVCCQLFMITLDSAWTFWLNRYSLSLGTIMIFGVVPVQVMLYYNLFYLGCAGQCPDMLSAEARIIWLKVFLVTCQ